MIWITGCNGLLGSEISRQMQNACLKIIGTGRDIDITDPLNVHSFLNEHNEIKWIINCAAYTAVDEQEDYPEKAFSVNAEGPYNLAKEAEKRKIKLIHFSTDYVFDGIKKEAYNECDKTNPLNIYGKSKQLGEDKILECMINDAYIIRTSWLYGMNENNFVTRILHKLREKGIVTVINDQTGCPTYARDLASVVLQLIKTVENKKIHQTSGIYHFSNNGSTTWFDFACAIKAIAIQKGLIPESAVVDSCTTSEYKQKAERPLWSVMNNDKISKFTGCFIPDWRSSLEDFFSEYIFKTEISAK